MSIAKIKADIHRNYIVLDENLCCKELSQGAIDLFGTTGDVPSKIFVLDVGSSVKEITNLERLIRAIRVTIDTLEPGSVVSWVNLGSGEWRKIHWSISAESHSIIYVHFVDTTDYDPRAQWLKRIDIGTQRLMLDDKYYFSSVSFFEYAVLHFLFRGVSYAGMATIMNVSTDTIGFRLKQLKNAFQVSSVQELQAECYDNGLAHLLTIDLDFNNPAMNEFDLYSLAD
jgi:hypothetical protein